LPNRRVQEIRDMNVEQRERRLSELRTELSKQKTMINAGGSIENPGQIKVIRKTIARILTVMREEGLES
jgi:large subunit ribosomal protein L29